MGGEERKSELEEELAKSGQVGGRKGEKENEIREVGKERRREETRENLGGSGWRKGGRRRCVRVFMYSKF